MQQKDVKFLACLVERNWFGVEPCATIAEIADAAGMSEVEVGMAIGRLDDVIGAIDYGVMYCFFVKNGVMAQSYELDGMRSVFIDGMGIRIETLDTSIFDTDATDALSHARWQLTNDNGQRGGTYFIPNGLVAPLDITALWNSVIGDLPAIGSTEEPLPPIEESCGLCGADHHPNLTLAVFEDGGNQKAIRLCDACAARLGARKPDAYRGVVRDSIMNAIYEALHFMEVVVVDGANAAAISQFQTAAEAVLAGLEDYGVRFPYEYRGGRDALDG